MYDEKKKNVEASDSHIYLIIELVYSVSDERIAMTRNHAISLPQHPPGPPSITQPSDSTDTAFGAPKTPPTLRHQLSTINFPPSTSHRLLTATTLPPSIAFRFITHSAIYRVFTKLKATFHLGLEPTHTAPFQPGDQRVNHHSTLSPRKFRLFGFELNRRVISDLTTRNIFSEIT